MDWIDRATVKRIFPRLPYSYTFFTRIAEDNSEHSGYRIETQALPAHSWVTGFVVQTATGYVGCSTHLGLTEMFWAALQNDLTPYSVGVEDVLAVYPLTVTPKEATS